MHLTSTLGATALLAATANAALRGFNYGAFFNNQAPKQQADFEYEFNAAKQLPGTNGAFTAARLYTMIQHGTINSPISAIQAAINTNTQLLLGLWASVDDATFQNEISALKTAISQYGQAFADHVVGISVGSEDLYRITPTGIENHSGVGAQPDQLIRYIQQTRAAIQNTPLAGKPIGHVDTWTAYVNGTNAGVISNLDFLGVDGYPYFQTTMANSIENANQTFYDSYQATVNSAQGKPVWVTETGWPVSGPQQNQAVASPDNARIYWEDVACSLMAKDINLFYYTLQDAQWGQPEPSFGIKPAGDLAQVQPLFDTSCPQRDKCSSAEQHVIGSSYSALISPTRSTIFNFYLSPSDDGKICYLVFMLPNQSPEFWTPYQITSPGGINVIQLDSPATVTTNARIAGNGTLVGTVPQLNKGQFYKVATLPCQSGTIGYKVDSLDGLNMQFFQVNAPPLGLFVMVSD
ncbi:glycoside hydrolase [Delitschia confertaspora ATCC 74209]|uniref:Probable glucan endo-1,3-beta-glucosidase eglC n=1 Tax=Delitschia confertaspora ATCC 74209 TaxID=1513339 RepID=A0A9P4JW85_9PLEO|nr:glycoside hydrolase [Delitschia confertaspora ATCC 74209]